MITTSYTAPYRNTSNTPKNPNTNREDIEGAWKPILTSPNVDYYAPQLYGKGSGNGIQKTNGVDVTFTDWTQLIHPRAEIIPMIQVYDGVSPFHNGIRARGGSKDGEYQHWINKFLFKCRRFNQFKRFCDAGRFFIWSGS